MSSSQSSVSNLMELTAAIAELEIKAKRQKEEMMVSFEGVKESFKPMNLFKQTLHSTFSPGKKTDLIGTALGLGSGLLGRKLLFGSSSGILGKLLGAAVEFGLGGVVAKNSEKIKSKGSELLEKIFPGKGIKSYKQPSKRIGLKTDPGARNLQPGVSSDYVDPEISGINSFPRN